MSRPQRSRKVVTHYSDDNPNTFTIKKKGQLIAEPKKIYIVKPVTSSTTPTSTTSTTTSPKKRKRIIEQPLPIPQDTILSHPVNMDPIILQQSASHNNNNKPFRPLHPPLLSEWKLLPTAYPFRTCQDLNDNLLELPPARITAFRCSTDTCILGDGAGHLLLYNSQRPIAKYDTIASNQEQLRKITSKATSLTFPNAIIDVDMHGQVMVALSASNHLTAVNLQHQTLWTFSIHNNTTQQISRRIHVLEETLFIAHDATIESINEKASLYRISHNATVLPIPLPGLCVAALWKNREHIYVIYDQTLAIINLKGDVLVSNKIVTKDIPNLTIKLDHLFVASKGIQCFDPETLQLLCVYGENVALHGKTVVWADVHTMTLPNYTDICTWKKQNWVHFDDFLQENDKAIESGESVLIGVPHPTKGPDELQSTLYVWKIGVMNPVATIVGPPGGLLGLAVNNQRQGLFCATAEFGQVHAKAPSMQSEFAGNMYPVGYRVITDNIEYMEDEDETDVVVRMENIKPKNDMEETIRIAREATEAEFIEDDDVSVLAEDNEENEETVVVPCLPERIEGESTRPADSPKRPRVNESLDLFALFPQVSQVKEEYTINEENKQKEEASDLERNGQKQAKAKRSKLSSIEQLLANSIDPILRQRMIRLQSEWGDGSGSTVTGSNLNSRVNENVRKAASEEDRELALELLLLSPHKSSSFSEEDKAAGVTTGDVQMTEGATTEFTVTPSDQSPTPQKKPAVAVLCHACRGRMVGHSCGKRALPIDYEAIERKEREKREAEQAEKERIRKEKRKAAEEKRKEARRLKKEEERQQLIAQQMDESRRRNEEERKRRMQEERMRELEDGQFDRAHIRERLGDGYDRNPFSSSGIPRYSEIHADVPDTGTFPYPSYNSTARHGTNLNSLADGVAGSHGSYHRSDSLRTHSSVASEDSKPRSGLDLLLGLAEIASETAHSDAKNGLDENGGGYGYAGSADRRNMILAQFAQPTPTPSIPETPALETNGNMSEENDTKAVASSIPNGFEASEDED